MPDILDETAIKAILKWITDDHARAAAKGDVPVPPPVEARPDDSLFRFWRSPCQ